MDTPNTKKRKAPPKAWKPGQSGNPKGRPRDGESWAATLTWALNLTGEQAAEIAPSYMSKEFKKLGKRQLREVISLRVAFQLLMEPGAALVSAVMDRIDGKPRQPVDLTWRDAAKEAGLDPEKLIGDVAALVGNRAINSGGDTESREGTHQDVAEGGPSGASGSPG